jgi:hypothetical protein
MVSVTHAKVVTTVDDGTSDVGSNEWNAEHVISGEFAVREKLEANRDYYVNPSLGDDTNDGLTSGAGAFETIQKAIDTVCDTLDLQGYEVIINCAAGNHAGEIFLRQYVGGNPQIIQNYDGGGEDQLGYAGACVTLRGVAGTKLVGNNPATTNRILRCYGVTTPWFLDRLEFDPDATGQDGIEVRASILQLGETTFHAGLAYCIFLNSDSRVIVQEYSDLIFTGGIYGYALGVARFSTFFMPEHCTIDIQDACTWDVAFMAVELGGRITIHRSDGISITGAQTGRRWYTSQGGELMVHYNVGGYQNLNSVLPGDTDGANFSWGGTNGLNRYRGLNIGASTTRTLVPGEGALGLDPLTVTTLPSSPYGGQICYVTDATTNTVATTVVGGSTYNTLVWYNGTNWSIFAS